MNGLPLGNRKKTEFVPDFLSVYRYFFSLTFDGCCFFSVNDKSNIYARLTNVCSVNGHLFLNLGCNVIVSPLVLTIKCSCVNARGNLTNSPKRQFLETI